MFTLWSISFNKLLCHIIILLCSVYVSAINRPNGGHFETHIPGSEYLEGIAEHRLYQK